MDWLFLVYCQSEVNIYDVIGMQIEINWIFNCTIDKLTILL